MRLLPLLVFVLFCSGDAAAKCSGAGIWAYPTGGELVQNSGILIIGYGNDQKLVDLLGVEHEVYLRSDTHQVKLKPREVHQGMMHLRQVFLQPLEQLVAGRNYELIIAGLDHEFGTYDRRSGKRIPYTYTTVEGMDNDLPAWAQQPVLKSREAEEFGCGPALAAVFRFRVDRPSGILFKTEFRMVGDGSVHTYLLTSDDEDGMLRVGHGMCSGAFSYTDEAAEYQVRFSLMDLAGNTDGSWTEWITFKSP